MTKWRQLPFGQLFTRVERKILLNDAAEYSCVGVRWYGLGTFVREKLLGMNILRKQQWIIHTGDVVYNKLFAWKGAFAIADSSVDGSIVSDKFPTYLPDAELVEPKWIAFYFKTPLLSQQAEALSKGAAAISKLTLNPPEFWQLTIPLPPLAEQRRIVARIETLEAKIVEARFLRHQAVKESESLLRSALSIILDARPTSGTLSEVLLEKPRNGWSPKCDNLDSGTSVLTLSAVTGFHYDHTAFKRTSELTNQSAHYWLNPGDLLFTRSNTPDLVGHAAIYDGLPSPCIYPDLMMKLKVDCQKADPRFIWYWLQSATVREHIGGHAKGTSPTMKKISQDVVMGIPFPVGTPICDQRRIVAHLDSLQAKVEALKRLQADTAAELDALLPSVLDRAFKGEL